MRWSCRDCGLWMRIVSVSTSNIGDTPNLQVGNNGLFDQHVVLVEQHPAYFKYRTTVHSVGGSRLVQWTARGVRGTPLSGQGLGAPTFETLPPPGP